ncbi:unnamed protein product [Angiostrongylus costaricensis]|uniref:Uncharacterized protein n=1 Tax=Angiostrongylus costaricensis TaxID=334426 RepID=A0A0R3PHF2_ANGCS|nr:unnamed protein product [Angiostrongylus costaricensis]
MDEVSSIQTNNSLSGNEKLLSLLNTIAALPREYRRLMEDFLNREATPTQVNSKYDIGEDPHSLHGQTAKVSSDPLVPKGQNPGPFPMKKDVDQMVEEHKNNSPNIVIRKSDMPSLDESPPLDLFEVLPPIYKYNIPNTQSFDLPTKAPFADKMDDADLLNPRTSLLSDAVHLLESAIPRFKAEILRNVTPNNASVALSPRLSLSMNEMRTDNVDNIASSQQNSVAAQNPSCLTYSGCRGLFSNGVSQAKYQKPQTKIFPKSSAQLLSRNWSDNISNHQGSLFNRNPSKTNQGTLFIENFPPAPQYSIAPRPKDTTEHNLLDMNRLGSLQQLTTGHFDEEQPYHTTPEGNSGTTTMMMGLFTLSF